jgi:hypothetical protein
MNGNMKSIENSRIRIATIQIDYQASACLRAAGSPISEPIIFEPISSDNSHHLNEIKDQDSFKETCESLMQSARSRYLESYIDKLQDILTYCLHHKVDLLVFPEYSIPVEAIETLKKFSSDMTIVAGIGYLGRKDLAKLENICIANNAAVILSPEKDFVISKKYAAQNESIEAGNGPETYNLKFRENTVRVSVSICLDFLKDPTSITDKSPEIVIVSALSVNTDEFTQKTPRDFITVFSNHSLYGGTCILSPEVRGEIFTRKNGTIPLNSSLEAIIILDWDCKTKALTLPRKLGDVKHPIFAISQIIYSGKDDGKYDEISKQIQSINSLMKDDVDLDRDEIRSKSFLLHKLIKAQASNNEIIDECFKKVSNQTWIDNMQDETIRSLSRHCLLREDALTINEWRYQQFKDIIDKFEKLQKDIEHDDSSIIEYSNITESLKAYKEKARKISHLVRSKLQEKQHRGTRKPSTKALSRVQSILVARLGNYTTSSAVKSLPKQLTMLKTLALSLDPNIVLCYRFRTEKDSLGFMHPHFDIICTTHDCSEDEVEALREGLGQLIHVTFTGAYSMGYSFNDAAYEESFQKIQSLNEYTVEIEIVDESNQLSSNPPDWGTIIDLLRSLSEPVLVELQCTKTSLSNLPKISPVIENVTNKVKSSGSVKSILNEILVNGINDVKNLQLRIFLGSSKEIPDSILNMIGIEMSGGNKFNIVTDYLEQSRKAVLKSPSEILKILMQLVAAIKTSLIE